MVETIWKQEDISDNELIREFDSSGLFEWHQDDEDRIVTVEHIVGEWSFIFDNAKPIQLTIGVVLNIQKDIFHRLNPPDDGKIVLRILKQK